MSLLTVAELKRVEARHSGGISSTAIVDIFKKKGERFSSPSLRKYVQLGLLPKSRRVGIRGRHRGSSGLYPVAVVRLINEIKRALNDGATLDEIRLGRAGVAGEVQALSRTAAQVADRLREAIGYQENKKKRDVLKREFDKRVKALNQEVRALDRLVAKLGTPRLQP